MSEWISTTQMGRKEAVWKPDRIVKNKQVVASCSGGPRCNKSLELVKDKDGKIWLYCYNCRRQYPMIE